MTTNDGKPKYELQIDLSVLDHLGINLYSNVPAVLTEMVANAWDADATTVDIANRQPVATCGNWLPSTGSSLTTPTAVPAHRVALGIQFRVAVH